MKKKKTGKVIIGPLERFGPVTLRELRNQPWITNGSRRLELNEFRLGDYPVYRNKFKDSVRCCVSIQPTESMFELASSRARRSRNRGVELSGFISHDFLKEQKTRKTFLIKIGGRAKYMTALCDLTRVSAYSVKICLG